MLVLTRKEQEKILVGENITITVIRVKGNSVRLGIDAPANVRIMRTEIQLKLEEFQILESEDVSLTLQEDEYDEEEIEPISLTPENRQTFECKELLFEEGSLASLLQSQAGPLANAIRRSRRIRTSV